jgi:hypothetical protein
MYGAATKGHLAACQYLVCQYLVAEQCPSDAMACSEAASQGHWETVRFLHESGCPWDAASICTSAALNGSVELMQCLKQQGCAFNEDVMTNAARTGTLQLCQYLRAEQCPWDARACRMAAYSGSVDTLRWLHEQGCPWDIHGVRMAAAGQGHLPILKYVMSVEPAASAPQLTEMLSAAATFQRLAAAKWLRQQGAEWPAVLRHLNAAWRLGALQWARAEGCTAPTTV